MANADGQAQDHLIEQLEKNPERFDFFQAVRRLESLDRDHPRVAKSQTPRDDAIRFGQKPSMAFAPSAIHSFQDVDGVKRMYCQFMGMLGPQGPMPLHFTEYVRDRMRNHDDPTTAAFLDMFHHRMISMFYRAWASSQKAVSYDRPDEDRFINYLGSLIGIGPAQLRGRDALPDHAKISYAGHLSNPTRHADGLEAILGDYFKIPVRVKQFFGHWMNIPADCRLLLGRTPTTGRLGDNTIIGSRMWNVQLRFRVRFGPMNLDQFERLLPGGASGRRLVAWVRQYTNDEFDWDVQLVLRTTQIPKMQLGRSGRLGWTTWVRTGSMPRDMDNVVLSPKVFA